MVARALDRTVSVNQSSGKEGGRQLDAIRRARSGDRDAFAELVGLHGGWVHRLAVVIVGPEEAADVTQDVLLRAWRELPRLRDDTRFEAWLRRILVNRCRDVGRAKGRRVVEIELDPATGAVPSADGLDTADRTVDLDAALARLSVDQRAVIALHFAADLTLADVAATMGVPIGTVKSRLNTALIHLRTELGRDEGNR